MKIPSTIRMMTPMITDFTMTKKLRSFGRLTSIFFALTIVPISANSMPITFEFEGVIGLSCFTCSNGSQDFGSGVSPGTQLTGSFTFDTDTIGTPTFQPNRLDYIGVSVEFDVGFESVSGNNISNDRIRIYNGPPEGDSYSLLSTAFSSGSIAGVTIDDFIWVVSGPSSLFSDLSLPLTPDFFGPLLGSRVCIGDCFGGEILEGEITALRLHSVPEPTTLALMGLGLAGLGYTYRKKK